MVGLHLPLYHFFHGAVHFFVFQNLESGVNIIKRHKKNNSIIREDINGESLKIEDNSISGYDPFHIIHKYLSETEAELLLEYNSCESKEERLALANKNNISLGNLAVKITRIKQKLRTEMENDAH